MSEGENKESSKQETMDDNWLPLADVIASLRSELKQARADGQEEDIRFLVEESEVELQFVVTKGAEGKVGVNFWVYTAEGGPKLEQEAVQTLRLNLKHEAINFPSPTQAEEYVNVYVSDEGRDRPPVQTESPTKPE